MGGEGFWTRESPPVTRALIWTYHATEQLVIRPWTLVDPITDMGGMKTHLGIITAIVTWTRVAFTVRFVLVAPAVVHTVTACEDGQTVAIPRTLVVGVRTERSLSSTECVANRCYRRAPVFSKGNNCWRGRWWLWYI